MCVRKRMTVLLLTVCLLLSWIPIPARAVCSHHTVHTEECGYSDDIGESSCSFRCDLCDGAGDETPVPVESFWITVSVDGGEPFALEISSADTLEQLLQSLAERGISLSDPQVCFENIVLKNSDTLASRGVSVGSALLVKNRYSVTITPSENGSVFASAGSYAGGERVSLTVSPSRGYVLDSLTASVVSVEENAGAYSFVMPEEPVSVTATFRACSHENATVFYDAAASEHCRILSCCLWQVTEPHDFGNDDHTCVCGEVERFSVSVWDGDIQVSMQDHPFGTVIALDPCHRDGYTLIGYALPEEADPATTYDSGTGKHLFTVPGETELHAVYKETCRCALTLPDEIPGGVVLQPYSHTFAASFTDDGNFGQEPVITYSISGGNLPADLHLDSSTGVLCGTPAAAGSYPFTITATANSGDYHQAVAVKDYLLTVAAKNVTVQALDQTITWGNGISESSFLVEGLLTGDTAEVLLTPSTENVTASGAIVPSQAVITSSYGNPDEIYAVTYLPGKLVIEPDTTGIDRLTEATVTSANGPDIRAAQEMMASAEIQDADDETKKNWALITEKCEALLEVISRTADEIKAVTDQVAAFDPNTVSSEEKADLDNTAERIRALLAGANLTEQERGQLEEALNRVQSMLDTLKDIAQDMDSASQTIAGLDAQTVKSSDSGTIRDAMSVMNDLLATQHLTKQEREDLEEVMANAENLLAILSTARSAMETENTKKAAAITASTVKASDKVLLENAKIDLQAALARYAGNYTVSEQQRMLGEISRIDGALEAIERAGAVTSHIQALPASAEPDDEETAEDILTAKDAYDSLTANERKMVPVSARVKLQDLLDDLTDYRVLKGNNAKWTRGSSTTLVFTVNGPVSKFTGIQIDGKRVSSIYYSVKSGSTIVTLSHFYIRSLSYGKHTIKFLYTDGEISAVFHTQPRTASPATGDDSGLNLWMTVMVSSGALLAAMFVLKKRINTSVS